jgi:hypothetical protein
MMIVILFHDGYAIYKFLNRWGESFFKMFYLLNFELFSIEGQNPTIQLYNKICETFIDYFEPLEGIDDQELENMFTNKKVQGKSKEHHFDVFIHRKLLDKKIPWQRRARMDNLGLLLHEVDPIVLLDCFEEERTCTEQADEESHQVSEVTSPRPIHHVANQ